MSSVLLCNHKSIQDETVRKVCENFQYLDMGIFFHILSGRRSNCNIRAYAISNVLYALIFVLVFKEVLVWTTLYETKVVYM